MNAKHTSMITRFAMILIVLIAAGCAEPYIEHVDVSGRYVTRYIGHDDLMHKHCGDDKRMRGCTWIDSEGQFNEALVQYATEDEIEHENAHVSGMRHKPWRTETGPRGNWRCTVITLAGGEYVEGDKICSQGGFEFRVLNSDTE